jgi:hypothetical protein
MPKLRSHRDPDPSPLTVSQRSALAHRQQVQRRQVAARLKTEYREESPHRPVPSMPRVAWLERPDIDADMPPIAPDIDAGAFFEDEATQEGEMDKTHLQRNFGKTRMDKTGKYTRDPKVTFTDDQFALISQAVKLSGQPFTEWARGPLLARADAQIKAHRDAQVRNVEEVR